MGEGRVMSDISDLEQRLAAALRRISAATEVLPSSTSLLADVAGSGTNSAIGENLEVIAAQVKFEKIQVERKFSRLIKKTIGTL